MVLDCQDFADVARQHVVGLSIEVGEHLPDEAVREVMLTVLEKHLEDADMLGCQQIAGHLRILVAPEHLVLGTDHTDILNELPEVSHI